MKHFVCSILFFLVAFISMSQNKKDSLYAILNSHPQKDSIRAKLLTRLCFYELDNDNEKTKRLASEALEISTKLNFARGIGYAHKYLGLYYSALGENEKAIQEILAMLKAFEGTSNASAIGESYSILGFIHELNNDLKDAKSYYEKALEIHERANLQEEIGADYASLGTLHISLMKYEEAITYLLKAVDVRKKIGKRLGIVYLNLGMAYLYAKDYDNAHQYFVMVLANDNSSRAIVGANLGLGEMYTLTKAYNKAEFHLVKAIEEAREKQFKNVLEEAYGKLFLLEKARGRYKSALEYAELRYQYKDSLFSVEKAQKIAEIETRYNTEKKDQTILALEQHKRLQNLKQTYLIIGILLVTVLFTLIYFLQRSYNRKVKRFLETQQLLNIKLKETDQLKSRFFANISHEFRTPLSLIAAPIEEKLSSPRLSENDKKTFQLVKRNTNRLLSLVTQLLDLSKLEAGKMELYLQQGNLNEFLSLLIASFDSLAESKKIHFSKSIHIASIETWYDADKLEKILNNLLFNAFKFTPTGGAVTLSIYSDNNSNDLQIKISDTGKGISQADLQHVFSPFYQSKNNADDGQPGTGLGLSLVKELVKLYGGTIDLVSFENKGTTITVNIPLNKDRLPGNAFVQNTAVEQRSIALLKEKIEDFQRDEEVGENEIHSETILIVEDNLDLRNFIAGCLQHQFTTLTAKDGEEGFAMATERIPSLIISDVMMPKLNGIDLTGKLKTDERTSHIPVVLLTAKADPESRMEGLTEGADDYLAKPFSTAELYVRVANLIAQRKKLAAKFRKGLPELPVPTVEASLDEKFVHRAKTIVEEKMADYSFSVEKMAEEMHLSRAQLFRKLKAVTGFSPNEFINNIRLQKAAHLIRAKADTLSQIGYAVGFNDQSYFAKRFRKKFGTSPSEYSNKS